MDCLSFIDPINEFTRKFMRFVAIQFLYRLSIILIIELETKTFNIIDPCL